MATAIRGQRGFPLHEAGGGRRYWRALRRRDRRGPWAPVLLRLIEIPAARLDGDLAAVQTRFEADAAPEREHRGVEYVAFDGAIVLERGTDLIDFAHIACSGEKAAVAAALERGDLGGGHSEQRGVVGRRFDAVQAAVIAGADQRAAFGIECDGIDYVLRLRPQLHGIAVGLDAINLTAPAHARGRTHRRRRRSGTAPAVRPARRAGGVYRHGCRWNGTRRGRREAPLVPTAAA